MTCLIYEMTDTGAHLKVSWPQKVPLHFTFTAADDTRRAASVVWWDIDAVGVRFSAKLVPPKGAEAPSSTAPGR